MPDRPSPRQRIQVALRLGGAIRLVWQSAPGWTLANLTLVAVQGVLPLAALYAMKRILDAVAAVVGSPWRPEHLQGVWLWILAGTAIVLLAPLTRLAGEGVTEVQSRQATDSVAEILHAQSVAVDLAYYEDPACHDTLLRAQGEASSRPARIVSGLVQIAQNGLALAGIAAWLITFNWLLAAALLLAVLPGALAGLYEDSLFLTNLYRFLDLKPGVASPRHTTPIPRPMTQGIAFRHVGFRCPGSKADAVAGIGLELRPGEVVALVGENGSGKSTIAKLLCRLYDPAQGDITVDGVNLRDLDPVAWRREISVAFQDFAHYAMTAGENIWLGDIEKSYDADGIAGAGARSGADSVVRKLPTGYDTMLGRWFQDGYELSTGEWQRLAMARAFWREARILILDEPSSALDPLAEAALLREFRTLLAGRSALIISHRLSTVQIAERIYVLDGGRIAEQGTHGELRASGGRYAEIYSLQAGHYRDR